MAGAKRVGVIAEDKSDVAVIKILIERLRKAPISTRHFVGNGCGKIVGKSGAWSRELFRFGCRYLVVVHDLDRNDINELKTRLKNSIAGSPFSRKLIIIPVEEIEAWLLSDEINISKFFNLKPHLKRIANPESMQDPKEKLAKLILQSSRGRKRYINNIHNEAIAEISRWQDYGSVHLFVP